ncbi:hypothetical protein [Sphingopyxis sp.]|uniref:hypothetical protein n=1 Tax=Sphingopyxis sp. TaxID=1908224 RepID=UPI001D26A7D2|nr:hypothetical protein [Sphingopyxis sp.]MBW8295674.1 hypothetical protein [Sphingopyxis sp.]
MLSMTLSAALALACLYFPVFPRTATAKSSPFPEMEAEPRFALPNRAVKNGPMM